jgi:hypothetical protein
MPLTFLTGSLSYLRRGRGPTPFCPTTTSTPAFLGGVCVVGPCIFVSRTVNPTKNDTTTYLRYVVAAVHGHESTCCTVTSKVHLMLKHVAWQMRNIPGGLGKKLKIESSKGITPARYGEIHGNDTFQKGSKIG